MSRSGGTCRPDHRVDHYQNYNRSGVWDRGGGQNYYRGGGRDRGGGQNYYRGGGRDRGGGQNYYRGGGRDRGGGQNYYRGGGRNRGVQNYQRGGGRDGGDGGRGGGGRGRGGGGGGRGRGGGGGGRGRGGGGGGRGGVGGGRDGGGGGRGGGRGGGGGGGGQNKIPILKRPGFGTRGRRVKVHTNHFLTTILGSSIHHYTVTIVKPKNLTKKMRQDLVLYLCRMQGFRNDYFGNQTVKTDGYNLFCPKPLKCPEAKIKLKAKLVINRGPDVERRYAEKCEVKLTASSAMDVLRKSLPDMLSEMTVNTLSLLGSMLRSEPSLRYTARKSVLFDLDSGPKGDLGGGICCSLGYFHSLRRTQMGLSLNIDQKAMAFYEPCVVIDFIRKKFNFNISEELSNQDRLKVEMAMVGVKITSDHGKKYHIVTGVSTKSVKDLMIGDKTLVDFYSSEYAFRLRYHVWPVLLAGKAPKIYQLPMETTSIVAGQCYCRDLDEGQASKLLEVTNKEPWQREKSIKQMVEKCNYTENNKDFEIQVLNEASEVEARILPAPMLKYHEDAGKVMRVEPTLGKWTMDNKRFFNAGSVDTWTCVNFSRQVSIDLQSQFCEILVNMCRSKGMVFTQEPLIPLHTGDPDRIKSTLKEIDCLCAEKGKHLKILIIILPDQKSTGSNGEIKKICDTELGTISQCYKKSADGSYEEIKRICDTELGIVSQCCQPRQALTIHHQFLEYVALKINVKVGGYNTELNDAIQGHIPPSFNRSTIIFGADVTHPGGSCTDSIAAVVASMSWPNIASYRASVSAQSSNVEIIQNLYVEAAENKGMIRELLDAFCRSNESKPDSIIFYRDGVGDSQFSQVLLQEMTAVKEACLSLEKNYRPRITFIVLQKRHHTRFFPVDDNKDKSGNILAGTVVDTGICHPTDFDFYLKSHPEVPGTARPAHYHVLFDENNFTANELQELTNALCYTNAMCTNSISIVPPVHYAHLAASRARCYCTEDAAFFPEVKENVKEVMYFC